MKEMLAATSDLKHFPKDSAPYGSLLAGRLATQSDLLGSEVENLGVFVQMDKDPAHVKMWKVGVKSLEDLNSAEEARRSSKAPKLADERELVEKTGMGWVEQVILRAAMAMGIVLSREQAQELGHEGDALDSAKFKQNDDQGIEAMVHDFRAKQRREGPQGVAQAGGQRAGG